MQSLHCPYNAILALAHGRTVCSEKLVIHKRLFRTDIKKDQNWLTIPMNQIREELLSSEEKTNLSKYDSKRRKMAMKVKIIEPLLKDQTADLRIWDMKKKSGPYVLNNSLKTICKDNNFKRLWAVRVDGELGFVLVKLQAWRIRVFQLFSSHV
ncbi:unnamed protein product [Fraxinus pennsylvanica]|uniref:Uncharacterized protein n=1 Tax=Fraxinus pennsylvanica TaxID=56036 RepID=A0AAD1ZFG2_9LAMI|nr:unnamed protein product [Fraxinus pennsylvanica]